jgi:hypothetical protein
MCARSLHGNREISGLTGCCTGLARIGKARSRSRSDYATRFGKPLSPEMR